MTAKKQSVDDGEQKNKNYKDSDSADNDDVDADAETPKSNSADPTPPHLECIPNIRPFKDMIFSIQNRPLNFALYK